MKDRATRWRTAFVAAAVLLVLGHCALFRHFVVDDAGISFAYARNLARGYGLVATPGAERVEAYSNPLWVFVLAGVARFGGDLVLVSRVLGYALATVIVVGAAELAAALRRRRAALDGVVALTVAAATPVAYWSMSGLEGGLYVAAIVWLATGLVREREAADGPPWSALLAAAVALTRPEGVLFLVVAAAVVAASGRSRRYKAGWTLLAVLPVAGHLAWRYSYFGLLLPHSYFAKQQVPFRFADVTHFDSVGWSYILTFGKRYFLWPMFGVAVLALSIPGRRAARGIVLVLAMVPLAFAMYVRGDWMSEGRFVVASIPLLAAAGIGGGEAAARWLAGHRLALLQRAARVALPLLCLGCAGPVVLKSALATRERVGNYPVPLDNVVARARRYAQLARALRVDRPSVLEADLGGTALQDTLSIVDLGRLSDVTIARWQWHSGVLREYVFGERRPTFMRLSDVWQGIGLHVLPEYTSGYLRVAGGADDEEIGVARSAVVLHGVDTRQAIAQFSAAGLRVIGTNWTDGVVRVLALVTAESTAAPLRLNVAGVFTTLSVASGAVSASAFKAGDVLAFEAQAPQSGAATLTDGVDSYPVTPGTRGAAPIVLPSPEQAAHAGSLARGDLELAAATATGADQIRIVAEQLATRGRAARAAMDFERAFRDLLAAIRVDPSASRVRLELEDVRAQRRSDYSSRVGRRLAAAERAFHLTPTGDTMENLAVASLAAEEPGIAVAAHLATGLEPPTTQGRLALADAYLALGLPSRALKIAPTEVQDLPSAERLLRIAEGGASADKTEVAVRGLVRKPVPVRRDLELLSVWPTIDSAGSIDLALALRRTGAPVAQPLLVGGRSIPFDRPMESWGAAGVFVHHVRLEPPVCQRPVPVGSATIQVRAEPFSQNFEGEGAWGWEATGQAFAVEPVLYQSKSPLMGFSGTRFVDSGKSGPIADGYLRSPPLSETVDQVCAASAAAGRLAGWRIENSGETVGRDVSGDGSGLLVDSCVTVPPGGRNTLVIYDQGKARVALDDVECFTRGRPVPCAGRVDVVY